MTFRRSLKGLAGLVAFGAVVAAAINLAVARDGRSRIRCLAGVRPATAALVLGAYVYPDGTPSHALEDRLLTGLELYRQGLVEKLLLSGDHGRVDYDEVNAMRAFCEARGVPKHDLFLDHAGFDTYDSLYRARDIFGVERLVVVTQRFHLPRALYIARALGLQAEGVEADRRPYQDLAYLEIRELGARLKAFKDVQLRRNPVHLGPPISILGDGRASHDQT